MARLESLLKDVESGNEQDFRRSLRRNYERLAQLFNGLISFGDGTNRDNIDGNWFDVTTPGAANTDFTVTHNLGRVPVGVLVMRKSAAVDIYTGSVAATTTQITLRATVASVNVKLFVL